MNGDYITELRRMADMLERNEVWVKNFTLSMGFDGDMDIRICLGGVGGEVREFNTINGSPAMVKMRDPAPGADALVNGLQRAMSGATIAPPRPPNPWMREYWNITEQSRYFRDNGKDAAVKAAQEAGSYLGATKPKESLTPAPGQTAVANGGYVVDPATFDKRPVMVSQSDENRRIIDRRRAEDEIRRLQTQIEDLRRAELAGTDIATLTTPPKQRVPEGTRDLDLDL